MKHPEIGLMSNNELLDRESHLVEINGELSPECSLERDNIFIELEELSDEIDYRLARGLFIY